MSAALSPAELVALWLPKLRKLALENHLQIKEVESIAWLEAAEQAARGARPPRPGKARASQATLWLTAVEKKCRQQRPGAVICHAALAATAHHQPTTAIYKQPEWQPGGDEPSMVLEAMEALEALDGEAVRAALVVPSTSAEVAQVLGCTARHARRILQKAVVAGQGDFFGGVLA